MTSPPSAPPPPRGRRSGHGPEGGSLGHTPTAERHVIASFVYPFRGEHRLRRWLIGVVLLILFPATFPVVFGYAVDCVQSAACDPGGPPPGWRFRPGDGALAALQAAVLTAPFVLLAWLIDGFVPALVNPALAWVVAVTVAALPWGVVMLVVVPPTLASFAVTGRPADLARPGLVVAAVRERYADWNLVLVAITTAWALAAVGLAVIGVGIVPGAFYAILVSAHACSALSPHRTTR